MDWTQILLWILAITAGFTATLLAVIGKRKDKAGNQTGPTGTLIGDSGTDKSWPDMPAHIKPNGQKAVFVSRKGRQLTAKIVSVDHLGEQPILALRRCHHRHGDVFYRCAV